MVLLPNPHMSPKEMGCKSFLHLDSDVYHEISSAFKTTFSNKSGIKKFPINIKQ